MAERGYSLQNRLAWRLSLVFLFAITCTVAGLLYRDYAARDTLRDRALQQQARDIIRHIQILPSGQVTLDLPETLRRQYQRAGGAFRFAVYDTGRRVLFASDETATAILDDRDADWGSNTFKRIDAQDDFGPYYAYATVTDGLRIVVAQSAAHEDVLEDSLIEEFFEIGGWWVLAIGLVAIWVVVLTIRANLRPLADLAERAQSINPATAEIRLPETGLPREIQPLVRAVNDGLDRLERGIAAQRAFTANAAHELRTPLAVLSARLDSLPRRDSDESLRRDAARMARLVNQLLKVARLDALPADAPTDLDLRALAEDAAGAMAPLAIRHGREIVFRAGARPVPVRGYEPSIREAITNLIENALDHSPDGGEVTVSVGPGGSVTVSDQGPGIPPEHRESVFHRFWRGAGEKTAGSGLGLAIVWEIARMHGGSVEIGDAAGGGAAITLRFRAIADPQQVPPGGNEPATPVDP